MSQKKKERLSLMERIRRALTPGATKRAKAKTTRAFRRWEEGWKRNGRLNGKPLTRSAIRRIGSRERAIKLGVVKA